MVFPGGTTALDGVSVHVQPRDFLVILGPSGAGKSTLLRMMNRLGTPTSGQVYFRGQDVTTASGGELRRLRQSVGMIFQQFNLVGRLSVIQNVLAGRLRFASDLLSFPLSHVRWFAQEHRQIAMTALQQVGVAHLAERRADTLSGGQQQRVAIARVLAQQPSVILADEPIASLDPRSAVTVMDILKEIHSVQKLPVVANLHQIDTATKYASRIVGVRAGKIVFEGEPHTLDRSSIEQLYTHSRSSSELLEDAQAKL